MNNFPHISIVEKLKQLSNEDPFSGLADEGACYFPSILLIGMYRKLFI
jgi:hypothetical protein